MEDPNPLRCRGSNHVPNHSPDCPLVVTAAAPDDELEGLTAIMARVGMAPTRSEAIVHKWEPDPLIRPERVNDAVDLMRQQLDAGLPTSIPPGWTYDPSAEPAGLSIDVSVNVTRHGRKRCPVCKRVRQLIRLTAYSAGQPVGFGRSRCHECAGLRTAR